MSFTDPAHLPSPILDHQSEVTRRQRPRAATRCRLDIAHKAERQPPAECMMQCW